MSQVLVTGGTGFVASHCIIKLVEAGHRVRTTLRNASREPVLRAMLARGGVKPDAPVEVCLADLTSDAGWADAVRGCEYVLHVASPMPPTEPQHEDELIIPAREGTLRVLRFARDAGCKRVVMTSTCGAIYYGHKPQKEPFDETSWTNIGGGPMSTYVKSKALAERAAWDFMKSEGGALELCTVNPGGIFGPALADDMSSSVLIMKRLLDGMPGCPRIFFTVVDVRDVADLHLLAMTSPAAKGERFIATTDGVMSMFEVANVLHARLGARASKVPTRELPSWLVRLSSLFKPELRALLPLLDNVRLATPAKAMRVLGWKPRSREDALVATATSLLELGVAG